MYYEIRSKGENWQRENMCTPKFFHDRLCITRKNKTLESCRSSTLNNSSIILYLSIMKCNSRRYFDGNYDHTWSEHSENPVAHYTLNIKWCGKHEDAWDLTSPPPVLVLISFPSIQWFDPVCQPGCPQEVQSVTKQLQLWPWHQHSIPPVLGNGFKKDTE